ncbi:hypothetical protein D3C85_982870 [compost metagenome]
MKKESVSVGNLFSTLFFHVSSARQVRDEFDLFWRRNPTRRGAAGMAYFIRHSALLQCFDCMLFLFSSKQVWMDGGLGAFAAQKGVVGPLLPLTSGDQIEKLYYLLIEHESEIKDIFSMHNNAAATMCFLNHQLMHIENVLHDFVEVMKQVELITV